MAVFMHRICIGLLSLAVEIRKLVNMYATCMQLIRMQLEYVYSPRVPEQLQSMCSLFLNDLNDAIALSIEK